MTNPRRLSTFPLRLPLSLKTQVTELAHHEGLSVNHLISLAVAEKISRMENAFWLEEAEVLKQFVPGGRPAIPRSKMPKLL
jgi:hypothetical protein